MIKTAAIIGVIFFIILVIVAVIMIAWILKGNNGEDKFFKELNDFEHENPKTN